MNIETFKQLAKLNRSLDDVFGESYLILFDDKYQEQVDSQIQLQNQKLIMEGWGLVLKITKLIGEQIPKSNPEHQEEMTKIYKSLYFKLEK